VDFVVCTLAVKKNQGRFLHVGSDHSLVRVSSIVTVVVFRAGVAVQPGWPCNGPLLQLAEDVARRLIAAFDTTTGMPYGTVNLRYGVPAGETSITCTAGVGTFILEFGTLSRLTGDPLFEEVGDSLVNRVGTY
jgi:mannosidase alpha-like ER degradation enhancer 2